MVLKRGGPCSGIDCTENARKKKFHKKKGHRREAVLDKGFVHMEVCKRKVSEKVVLKWCWSLVKVSFKWKYEGKVVGKKWL